MRCNRIYAIINWTINLLATTEAATIRNSAIILQRLKAVADLYETREAAADGAGISVAQLYRYMSGQNRVPFEVVIDLCDAKEISFDWLVYGESRSIPSDAVNRFNRVRESQVRREEEKLLRRAEIGMEVNAMIERVLALKSEDVE